MINEIQDRMPASTVRSILNEVITELNTQSEVFGEPILEAISGANTPSEANPFATLVDLPEIPATWSMDNTTTPINVAPPLSGYVPTYDSNGDFQGTKYLDTSTAGGTVALRATNGRLQGATPSGSNLFELVNIQYLSQYGRGTIKYLNEDYTILPEDYDLNTNKPTTLICDLEESHDITITIPSQLPSGVMAGMSTRIAVINNDLGNQNLMFATSNPDHIVCGENLGTNGRCFGRLTYVGFVGSPAKHYWAVG